MFFSRVCLVMAAFICPDALAHRTFIVHLAGNSSPELVQEQIRGIVNESGGVVTSLFEQNRLLAELSRASEARVRGLPGVVGIYPYEHSPSPVELAADNVFYRVSLDPSLSDGDHARLVRVIERIALRPDGGSGYVTRASGRSLVVNLRPHAARQVAELAGVAMVEPSNSSGGKACGPYLD